MLDRQYMVDQLIAYVAGGGVKQKPSHFDEGINKRLDWISDYLCERLQHVTAFDIYWVLVNAMEDYIEKFPVNRRRKWHFGVNQTGTRRWTDCSIYEENARDKWK